MEAEVEGENVRAEKSEPNLAQEHNTDAKCMQNCVGASQNRQKKKQVCDLFIFFQFGPCNLFKLFNLSFKNLHIRDVYFH